MLCIMMSAALGPGTSSGCNLRKHSISSSVAVSCGSTLRSRGRRLARSAIASPEAADQLTPLNNLFEDLCNYHDIHVPVKLRHSTAGSGIGLFAVNSISKGDTILRIPKSLCIILDNGSGSLSIPKGDWPRLTGGIMQDTALSWDILMGLALMDATAGNGDQFWESYSDHFLQQPEDLTLPMCWNDDLSSELQHPAIIAAAQQQQQRLRTLLPPEYMQPIDQGLPSYLQWGFANVRSRALQLGPQAFGMVPFIDIANHAAEPNADVRTSPAAASSSSSSNGEGAAAAGDNADQGSVDLYAVEDIPSGTEVTISYSGVSGYTNQRWMAQYGFVPASGNAADRLELNIPESYKDVTFRMTYLEDALGTQLLMDAARGSNPYLMAALKSLPLTADDPQAPKLADVETSTPSAVTAAAAGNSAKNLADDASVVDKAGPRVHVEGVDSSTGRGMGPARKEEVELAALLSKQIHQELQSSKTTLQQDEQLLQQLQKKLDIGTQDHEGDFSSGPENSKRAVPWDARLVSAVKYRVERKKLLQACQVLLNIFLRE